MPKGERPEWFGRNSDGVGPRKFGVDGPPQAFLPSRDIDNNIPSKVVSGTTPGAEDVLELTEVAPPEKVPTPTESGGTGRETQVRSPGKKKRKTVPVTSLDDLGAAVAAREAAAANGGNQNGEGVEKSNVLPFVRKGNEQANPETPNKSFSKIEANKPQEMQRLPDESLPEYRARMKSTLAHHIAGVTVTGVDASKVVVKLPSVKRQRKLTVEQEQREKGDLENEIKAALEAKNAAKEKRVSRGLNHAWDRAERRSLNERLSPAYRAIDRAANDQVDSSPITVSGKDAPVEEAQFDIIRSGRKESGPTPNPSLEYLGTEGPAKKNEGPIAIEASWKHKLDTQRQSTEEAKNTYFAALKEFQKNRNGLGVAMENFTGDKSARDARLKELRREWVRSRAAFARTQLESVDARLKDRKESPKEVLAGLKNYKGKGHFTPEEIKARYERIVTVRTTVLGAEEAEQQTRFDGLNERDKGRLEKAFDWYKRQPAWARIASTSALMFGGAALFGSGVGLAALGLGGARIAANHLAELNSGTLMGNRFAMAGRVLGLGAIAGLAAEGAVRGVHWVAGTKRDAKELLANRKGLGDLTDENNLDAISQSRRKALKAEETVARHGRFARIAASLTGGWLFGQALNSHDAPHAVLAPEHGHSAGGVEHPITNAPSAPHVAGVAEEVAKVGEKVNTIHTESLSIHGNVSNADRLFGHFRDQLAREYPDPSTAPASVRTLIEHTGTQDQLTTYLGFQGRDGLSAMMHEGDTVSVQANGEIVFTTARGESFTVIDAEGKMHRFDLSSFPTTGGSSAPHEVVENTARAADVQQGEASPVESTAQPAEETAEVPPVSDSETIAQPSPEVVVQPDQNVDAPTLVQPEVTPEPQIEAAPIDSSNETPVPGVRSLDEYVASHNQTDGLLNLHNVPIDATAPHEYVWQPTGTDSERLFAFGGTTEAASNAAREYVQAHLNTSMLFVTERVSLLGVVESRTVSEWVSSADGTVTLHEQVLGADGLPLAVPRTDDFTRIIN